MIISTQLEKYCPAKTATQALHKKLEHLPYFSPKGLSPRKIACQTEQRLLSLLYNEQSPIILKKNSEGSMHAH